MAFLGFLMAAVCPASESHSVKTSNYGNFEFLSVSVQGKIFGSKSCMISADIRNDTNGSWTGSEFKVELLGAAKDQSIFVTIDVPIIPFGEVTKFRSYC